MSDKLLFLAGVSLLATVMNILGFIFIFDIPLDFIHTFFAFQCTIIFSFLTILFGYLYKKESGRKSWLYDLWKEIRK